MTPHAPRCATFRVYTAALADGERAHVPWRARLHLVRCGWCRAEAASQAGVTRRIRRALALPERGEAVPATRRARPWLVAGFGAVAAAAVTIGLILSARQDVVPAAAAAAGRPPTIRAVDAATIDRWCSDHALDAPPTLTVAPLAIEGARMDTVGGATMLITVYYLSPAGDRLTVTWVSMTPIHGGAVQTTSTRFEGRPVLVVRAQSGATAVITGTATPTEMWQAAGAIASTL